MLGVHVWPEQGHKTGQVGLTATFICALWCREKYNDDDDLCYDNEIMPRMCHNEISSLSAKPNGGIPVFKKWSPPTHRKY